MFESAPQSKCAVAYKIIKADKEVVNIAVIYSIIRDDLQSDVTSILLCLDEITQMCTAGTSDIIILGTQQGSFYLYDLKDIQNNV